MDVNHPVSQSLQPRFNTIICNPSVRSHCMLTVCSWLPAMLNKAADTAPALTSCGALHVITFTRTSASTPKHSNNCIRLLYVYALLDRNVQLHIIT